MISRGEALSICSASLAQSVVATVDLSIVAACSFLTVELALLLVRLFQAAFLWSWSGVACWSMALF